MKTKQKLSLIMFCVIILSPSLFTVSAINYDVAVIQDPPEVYAGEIVTVTVTVNDMIRDEEIVSARILLFVNSYAQSIYPEETLPMRENVLTFILCSFAEGDIVKYKLYMTFQLQSDRYGNDYAVDEWYSFTIPAGTRPLLSISEISLIVVASLLLIGVIVIIIRRRKK